MGADKILQARRIAGDGPNLNRIKGDFYPTPPFATEELIKREKFEGSIWEPACGKGHISKVLEEKVMGGG